MRRVLQTIGALALCLVAVAGCSPATTFDGLSASFARMETNFAKDPAPQEEVATAASGELGLPELAYVNSAPPQVADQAEIDFLIDKYASIYNVPVSLVHRVVNRESTYKSHARNGVHMGLMQINPQTARSMGYDGPDVGLLDAETNLRYGVKYLKGAYLVAEGNHDRADKLYQTGYYYHAKRMGLLKATGLRP